jgi:hypothetical protein
MARLFTTPLQARFAECGGNSIPEFESCQAAWRHLDAQLIVLTQDAEFSLTLAFHEFQLAQGAGVTDIGPVITDEDIPDT